MASLNDNSSRQFHSYSNEGASSKKLLSTKYDPRSLAKADRDVESEETVEIDYTSDTKLVEVLERHKKAHVHVHISNVVDMIADLRRMKRESLLQHAVVAWFYYALGFPVLEAECKEQPSEEDAGGGLLLFRVRLDADYEQEVAAQPEGQELGTSFRDKLVDALPGQSAEAKSSGSLNKMVKVNYTKAGTIELGGVASLHVIILIVMAIGLSHCKCDCCSCEFCPCFIRPGRKEGMEYACAVRELRARGTDFEVNPDGTATMRVPPESGGICSYCSIL